MFHLQSKTKWIIFADSCCSNYRNKERGSRGSLVDKVDAIGKMLNNNYRIRYDQRTINGGQIQKWFYLISTIKIFIKTNNLLPILVKLGDQEKQFIARSKAVGKQEPFFDRTEPDDD